jgi:hypothetical protein
MHMRVQLQSGSYWYFRMVEIKARAARIFYKFVGTKVGAPAILIGYGRCDRERQVQTRVLYLSTLLTLVTPNNVCVC